MKSRHIISFICLLFIAANSWAQCSCTACNTSSTVGCTYIVNAANSTARTLNAGEKLCIQSGGNYTGNITMNGGTVVVASGGTFNPGFENYNAAMGTIENQSGGTVTMGGFFVTVNAPNVLSINNCGTWTQQSSTTVGGAGAFIWQNSGTWNGGFNGMQYGNAASSITNCGTYSTTGGFQVNSGGTFSNCAGATFNSTGLVQITSATINNYGWFRTGSTQLSGTTVNMNGPSSWDVVGNWTETTSTINGGSTCARIDVSGTSSGAGSYTGSLDFCDAGVPAPFFDTWTGTKDGSVTQCSCFPLPIELIMFTAKAENAVVAMNWATATETNNDYYTIERSTDAVNYTNIGTIDGAGNSITKLTYNFNDENPYDGISYYRLKQTDFDGHYSYSNIVPVNFTSKNNGIQILLQPNPADDKINVSLSSEYHELQMNIVDILGRVMIQQRATIQNNDQQDITLNISDLKPGVYFFSVNNVQQTAFKKVKFVKSSSLQNNAGEIK